MTAHIGTTKLSINPAVEQTLKALHERALLDGFYLAGGTGLALQLGEGGFILTDRDIPPGGWPLPRAPLPFETSLPGVFAVGDVRHSSLKRVAAAAGEGSVGVGSVHGYLAALGADLA